MLRRTLMKLAMASAGQLLLNDDKADQPAWPPPPDLKGHELWKIVRPQYSLDDSRVYLNTGSLGPAPRRVVAAMHETIDQLQRISETGRNHIVEARQPVAEFFGAQGDEIAFTRNATEGNATIAAGLDLRSGDEIIFESHAHAGGAIPWMVQQKCRGAEVRVFEPDPTSGPANVERIAELVTSRTRAIQISHVTAPTGIQMPVKEIASFARDKGIWFHIDGAQSAGMIPIDLHEIGCDSFATSCHKWMGAPHGTGVLYIRSGRWDDVTPTDVGAYSSSKYDIPDEFEFHPSAVRYECGTRDAASVRGIREAVRFLQQIGMRRVAEYGSGLATQLIDGLSGIRSVEVLTPANPTLRASLTTFRVAAGNRELYEHLMKHHRLRCRFVHERGIDGIRISTHLFNTAADCQRVLDAVAGSGN